MRLTVLVAMSCGLALGELPACVVDSADARQLDTEICEVSGGCAELTVRWCAAQCRAASFALAGVEAGHQCCCGDELTDASALADPSECDVPCTGNASETCGGSYRLYVVDASTVPPPPPPPDDPVADSRWILNGDVLRSGGYSCQPYCAVLPSGTWSCVMTYIAAPQWAEGAPGEHRPLSTLDRAPR